MIALAAVAVLKFSGGTINDLATAFRTDNRDFVVSMTRDQFEIKPFSVDLKSLDTINDGLKAGAKLAIVPGAELTFSDGMLPRSRVAGAFSVEPEGEALPTEALSKGAVTYKSDARKALEIGSLSAIKWSKPLTVHWFYSELETFCNVKNLRESQFLRMVARSVGATFREDPRGYYFELNPSEAQRRAIATVKSPPPATARVSNVFMAQRKLAATAISALTFDQVAYLLEQPGRTVRLALNRGSSLYSDAMAYRQALMQGQPSGTVSQTLQIQIDGQSGENVVRVVPQQAQPGLVISSNFQVTFNGR